MAQATTVGGVDVPRVLICGPELITNRSFEENLNGVTGPGALRVQDVGSPFGDWILQVKDDDAATQEYAEIAIETGANIANKRFVVVGWVRNDLDDGSNQLFWTDFNGLTPGDFTRVATADSTWRQLIVHEVVVPAGATGTQLNFRIYPFDKSIGVSGTGTLRVDNVRCREVLDNFEFPEVPRDSLTKGFAPSFQARNQLVSGTLKTYNRRVRFIYEANYSLLSATDEENRRKIITTTNEILFFPHKDSANAFFVEWGDADYDDLHAFGMAEAGNAGNVTLTGVELIPQLANTLAQGYTFVSETIII